MTDSQRVFLINSSSMLTVSLLLIIAALFVISLFVGYVDLPINELMAQLLSGRDGLYSVIFTELRLPRTLLAIVVGASLGISGAAMQGLLRNPLASPGLMGSSSGAALCAVITLYFGLHSLSSWFLPVVGMLGALIATATVYFIAGKNSSITTIILAGVAVNAGAAAGISLAINLAPSPYAVREIALWILGDLSKTSMQSLWIMFPSTLIGWIMIYRAGASLNALSLGEQTAQSMGINMSYLRWRIFIATSLATGAAVATVGNIGFIGLVVPHLLRPLVGHEPQKLLLVSALGGAIMLLVADIGVRLIEQAVPLQVGVLTSIVGAPFFLYLIVTSKREFI